MAAKPRVLITGATGLIGSAVFKRVARDPTVEVIAGVRSSRSMEVFRGRSIILDYDRPETILPALRGVDRVFMLTGYTIKMFVQSKDFLAAAREADVEHIVHLGAPGYDATRAEHWLWHQFIERYIEWGGFSFTHLRPDIFMQNLLGYGGMTVVDHGVIRHYVANTPLTWIDGEDVAAVAATVLLNPQEHCEKTCRIGADLKSFPEIAATLSHVVGLPFSYEPRPPSEFLETVLAGGADPGYMQSVYENYMAYTDGRTSGDTGIINSVSHITGHPPALMEDFVRRHLTAFVY